MKNHAELSFIIMTGIIAYDQFASAQPSFNILTAISGETANINDNTRKKIGRKTMDCAYIIIKIYKQEIEPML